MVAACTVLLLGAVASAAPPLPSGARVILTQRILDAVRDAALPVALDFLRTYHIPDFETDKDYVITPTSADLSGYTLSVNFTNPEIDMTGGTYALVGTDVQIALAPSPP